MTTRKLKAVPAASPPRPYSLGKSYLSNVLFAAPNDTLAGLVAEYGEASGLSITKAEYDALDKAGKKSVKGGRVYLVGATMKGKKRDDSEVVARNYVTLDVEALADDERQPPPPEDTYEALALSGEEGWVFTSLNHTKEKPRYRVVLPLATPLTGDALTNGTLEATAIAAARGLGIDARFVDEKSWGLSQPMILPAKFKGGEFWSAYTGPGRACKVATPRDTPAKPATARAARLHPDPIVDGLMRLGRHIREDREQAGKHFFRCPWAGAHSTESDTKTVYYESGSYDRADVPARGPMSPAGCNCKSTSHEPLTLKALRSWLKKELGEEWLDAPATLMDFPALRTGSNTKGHPLRPNTLAELRKLPPIGWAVEAVLQDVDTVILGGDSTAGKTFVAVDLTVALAHGTAFFSYPSRKRGVVVYVAAEGARGIEKRIRGALQKHRLADSHDVLVIPAPFRLALEKQCIDLVMQVFEVLDGRPCVALVLDTLAKVTAGIKENTDEMSLPLTHIEGMGRALGCMVLAAHHTGKDPARGLRGWSGLRGGVDAVLMVERRSKGRVLVVDKMKDAGNEGLTLGFDIVDTTLDDGQVTGQIVLMDALPPAEKTETQKRLELALLDLEPDDEGSYPVDAVLVCMLADQEFASARQRADRKKELLRSLDRLCGKPGSGYRIEGATPQTRRLYIGEGDPPHESPSTPSRHPTS